MKRMWWPLASATLWKPTYCNFNLTKSSTQTSFKGNWRVCLMQPISEKLWWIMVWPKWRVMPSVKTSKVRPSRPRNTSGSWSLRSRRGRESNLRETWSSRRRRIWTIHQAACYMNRKTCRFTRQYNCSSSKWELIRTIEKCILGTRDKRETPTHPKK